jgi:hypothetical protein
MSKAACEQLHQPQAQTQVHLASQYVSCTVSASFLAFTTVGCFVLDRHDSISFCFLNACSEMIFVAPSDPSIAVLSDFPRKGLNRERSSPQSVVSCQELIKISFHSSLSHGGFSSQIVFSDLRNIESRD